MWQAREVKEDGLGDTVYVLKDAWIDSDRKSEGDVIAQIKEDAQTGLEEEDRKMLLDCLLTTYIAGNVILGPDKPDSTIDGRKRTRLFKSNARKFSLKPTSKSSNSAGAASADPPKRAPSQGTPTLAKTKLKPASKHGGACKPTGDHRESAAEKKSGEEDIVYSSKTHYRIVFKEVCEVLHEVKSLERVVWALAQASTGMCQLLTVEAY